MGSRETWTYPVAKLSSDCVDGNVSLQSDNFPSVTRMHVDFISQKPSVLVIEQNHQDVCIITADDDPSVGGCQVNDMEDTTPELVTNLTVSPLANHPARGWCCSVSVELVHWQQLFRTQMETGRPCLLSLLGRVGDLTGDLMTGCGLSSTPTWTLHLLYWVILVIPVKHDCDNIGS